MTVEDERFRKGVDQTLSQNEGALLNSKAWEEELAFIRERSNLPAVGGQRIWTRDELYAGRLPGHQYERGSE